VTKRPCARLPTPS